MRKIVSLPIVFLWLIGAAAFAQSVTNYWWVRVTLKNDSSMEGAVVRGRFVEKADAIGKYRRLDVENVESLELVRGAGIRLYYVGDHRGFLFLPYAQIARVEIVSSLHEADIEEMGKNIDRDLLASRRRVKAEAEQERQRDVAGQEERAEGTSTGEELAGQVAREEVLARLSPPLREMIVAYPPEEGWSEAKYLRLNARYRRALTGTIRRIITLPDGTKRRIITRPGGGLFGGLDPRERYFVDNFDRWQQAIAEFARQREMLIDELGEREKEKAAEELRHSSPE